MPGYVGFQLAIELTSLFPAAKDVVPAIINFARDLRKSGSDIVVEADLADIFGRARVLPVLEEQFEKRVKISKITPLHTNSEIELHSGPGPTVMNALRDRRYMSTVIQLSLLAWTVRREDLASMLATCMRERFKGGIPGARLDTGYEGIADTLAAVSSQTSNFNWFDVTSKVEERLRLGIPTYQYSPDYVRITPAIMLGAMDFLYAVQTLPEDRRIVVSNEIGSIALIAWAHYVLGLTVSVEGPEITRVQFGSGPAQLIIHWPDLNTEDAGTLTYPQETCRGEPEIRLLDQNMEVQLACTPDESPEGMKRIMADDRHILQGWGTTYLERIFNTISITGPNDPVYGEAAHLSTGIALVAAARLCHDISTPVSEKHPASNGVPEYPNPSRLESWRVMQSARMLFSGLVVEDAKVEAYVKYLAVTSLRIDNLPHAFDAFLKRVYEAESHEWLARSLLDSIQKLSATILTTAHIANLKDCAHVPLRMMQYKSPMHRVTISACRISYDRIYIKSHETFYATAYLLSNCEDLLLEDGYDSICKTSRGLFLWSDFGWSVFPDSVGDKDPADIRPELVYVRQGTPVNTITRERKFAVRDGYEFARTNYPGFSPFVTGPSYEPSDCARASLRKEIWTSHRQEFECSLHFKIEVRQYWLQHIVTSQAEYKYLANAPESLRVFDETGGYRHLHSALWVCYRTPQEACGHQAIDQISASHKLGPDAVVLWGFKGKSESVISRPERVIIMMTYCNSHLRWLAVNYHFRGRIFGKSREMMLRSNDCCAECALRYTASLPGNWILVL